MRYLQFVIGSLAFCAITSGQVKAGDSNRKHPLNATTATDIRADKQAIRDLIRKVLNWKEQKSAFVLLPALTDKKSKVYIGFDLKELQANLTILKATGFFSTKFINNYNRIILTLDTKLRKKQIEQWEVGDLPTFKFANDEDPWCLCQDVPYDKPNAWNNVEVESIDFDGKSGMLYWKWGKLQPGHDSSWDNFEYPFGVEKEGGKWKISYLRGFDFEESTR